MPLGDLDVTRLGPSGLLVYCHVCRVGLSVAEADDPDPLLVFLEAHEHLTIHLDEEPASADAHSDHR